MVHELYLVDHCRRPLPATSNPAPAEDVGGSDGHRQLRLQGRRLAAAVLHVSKRAATQQLSAAAAVAYVACGCLCAVLHDMML